MIFYHNDVLRINSILKRSFCQVNLNVVLIYLFLFRFFRNRFFLRPTLEIMLKRVSTFFVSYVIILLKCFLFRRVGGRAADDRCTYAKPLTIFIIVYVFTAAEKKIS